METLLLDNDLMLAMMIEAEVMHRDLENLVCKEEMVVLVSMGD